MKAICCSFVKSFDHVAGRGPAAAAGVADEEDAGAGEAGAAAGGGAASPHAERTIARTNPEESLNCMALS
jgi:hypothetical protein